MPPQQYHQPVLPPRGPVFQNPYGNDVPPKRGKWKWVVLALVLAAAIGAGAWWYFTQRTAAPEKPQASTEQKTDTPAATGNLRVGPYYYVAACNAFSSEDFKDATGTAADDSVISTDFSTNTYPDKKDRSVLSSCGRIAAAPEGEAAVSIDVSIRQYPDTKRTRDQLLVFGLTDAKTDNSLGGRAAFRSPSLTLEAGNRVVIVTVQGYGDMSNDDIKKIAYAAATKISGHLRAEDQQALSVFNYPETVEAPAFTYHNACSLWGLADFTQLYGEPDESSIEMRFATAITEQQQTASIDHSTKATCVMSTYNKDFDLTKQDHAYVEVDYYPTKEQAAENYDAYGAADAEGRQEVTDLGDRAVQAGDQLIVLTDKTMVRVQFKEHNGDPAAQVDLVAMAKTILTRLAAPVVQ